MSYDTIRTFAETHFNWILMSAFLIGMVAPGLDKVPPEFIVYGTGAIIFLACARISIKELEAVDIFTIGGFSLVRFIMLPFVVYFAAMLVVPDLAIGSFLLALMPAGVAVAVLTAITAGNVALGLSLTIVSSLLAPFVVPSAFAMLGHMIHIDLFDMFKALVMMVFFPIGLYFGLARPIKPVKKAIRDNGKFISIILMVSLTAVIVAQKRDVFFEDPWFVFESLAVLSALFFVFYASAWVLAFKAGDAERIAYTYGSGAMNNNLGIALAYLYFDGKTAIFLILSEVIWVLAMSTFQTWLKGRNKVAVP